MNRRLRHGQTDYVTALHLSPLPIPMAPAHCYRAQEVSALQEQLLECAPNTTVIYALVDPTTRHVRYIGMTKRLSQRYQAHYSQPCGVAVCEWIKQLRARRRKPLLCILELTTPEQARYREVCWIRRYAPHSVLLNSMYHARKKKQIVRQRRPPYRPILSLIHKLELQP